LEIIRKFNDNDLNQMINIWNEIIDTGNAFPQNTPLTEHDANNFFSEQTFTGVLEISGEILGLYILHPNNVGRCSHIANASYAVKIGQRGKRIGEKLILHSMDTAKNFKYRILQFNAVTVTNTGALHLYKKLGFTQLGTIPGGFLNKDNEYIDIIPHYIELI
jgi:L-amino acid N-acyltransferase YncA